MKRNSLAALCLSLLLLYVEFSMAKRGGGGFGRGFGSRRSSTSSQSGSHTNTNTNKSYKGSHGSGTYYSSGGTRVLQMSLHGFLGIATGTFMTLWNSNMLVLWH